MKKKNENLEKNISRLIKRTNDSDKPSQAFIDSLTQKALEQLHGSAKKPQEENKMKSRITKTLAWAACFTIVCLAAVWTLLPTLNKTQIKPENIVALNYDSAKPATEQNMTVNNRLSTTIEAKTAAPPAPAKMVAKDKIRSLQSESKGLPTNQYCYKDEFGLIRQPVIGRPFNNRTYREILDPLSLMTHGGTTPPNGEPVDAMFFKNYGVNPFIDTEDDHLSTFATDVDTGSYTIARSYLHDGHLPPNDAIRVEEFVNYFKYNYPAPQQETFATYNEITPWPFTSDRKNTYLFRVALKAQKIAEENRKPAVLTFVIDVSGSMNRENRLDLVKKSLRMLIDNLKENDRIGIAVYGSNGHAVMHHKSLAEKAQIISAIESLHSEGSTNAEEGIRIGYEMAHAAFTQGAINRVILCSDGVANVGRTGADDILEVIKQKAAQGITLSTVGFGMGNYNDVMLERLGDKGNGSYAYIDTITEAKRLFADNLTGTLQVVARDTKVQIDFNPETVRSYRLIGYENRDVPDDKFRDDTCDGGEIGAGHAATALYEIKLWPDKKGTIATTYIRYKNADTFEPSEFSQQLHTDDIKDTFKNASPDFQLAASAMQFAEILRESHWAKSAPLDEVINPVRSLPENYTQTPDIIELTDLIAKAKQLKTTDTIETPPTEPEPKIQD